MVGSNINSSIARLHRPSLLCVNSQGDDDENTPSSFYDNNIPSSVGS